jgi:hypothetical protein
MAGSVQSYKCPADQYLSALQNKAGFTQRVRSYSMNDFVGQFSDCPSCGDGGPGTGTDNTFSAKNQFNTGWPQYLKTSAIPQPATIYVFVEEQADSINDGYFDTGTQNAPNDRTPMWGSSDVPAAYHNQGAGFSFSDGHSEIHHWLNSYTAVQVKANPNNTTPPTPPGPGGPYGSYVDRVWLCAHACILP